MNSSIISRKDPLLLLLTIPPTWLDEKPPVSLALAALAGYLRPRWKVKCLDLNHKLFMSNPELVIALNKTCWFGIGLVSKLQSKNAHLFSAKDLEDPIIRVLLTVYEKIFSGESVPEILAFLGFLLTCAVIYAAVAMVWLGFKRLFLLFWWLGKK